MKATPLLRLRAFVTVALRLVLRVLVFAIVTLPSLARAQTPCRFQQGSGYDGGAYDLNAIQPTVFDWSRQARCAAPGPQRPATKWRFGHDWADISGNSSPIIASDGTILVRGNGRILYAVNPDGSVKWVFDPTGLNETEVTDPVIGVDGTVYVASYEYWGGARLHAVRSTDGALIWTLPLTPRIDSPPVIGKDGTIYIGTGSFLSAINPNGTLKWQSSGQYWVRKQPAIGSDGTIYVTSYYPQIYAINPDGTGKWMFEAYYMGVWDFGAPAIGPDGTLCVGSILRDTSGLLLAIDTATGTLKWTVSEPPPSWLYAGFLAQPAIGSDGTIYIGSQAGMLHALHADGSAKWTFTSPTNRDVGGSAPIIGSDGTIYVGSSDGLWAINADGTLKWGFPAPYYPYGPGASSPAIGSDGTIYFVSDHSLWAVGEAIPIDETVAASSPSTNGFVLGLTPPLAGLTAGDLVLTDSQDHPVTITSVETADSGATYTAVAALIPGGTYTVTAVKAGYTFGAATFTVPNTVTTPVITWANPADIVYGTALGATQLNATASVPGTFAYTPAAGTVLGAGQSQTLGVTFTPMDTTNYSTASATVTINVNPVTPTLTIASGPFIYDGTPHPASATALGLDRNTPVSGTFVLTYLLHESNGAVASTPPVDAGNYDVTATFTSTDANYAGASGTGSITINRASQTIIVTTPAPATALYGATFTVAATGGGSDSALVYGSSGACTNSGVTYTMTSGTGTCTVMIDQPGNNNYGDAAKVTESVTAQKANQTVTFAALVDRTYGDPDSAVSATANSGLPVAFSASGNCTVSGNVVHVTGAGSCTITAEQGGDANYNSAPSVSQSFTIVGKASQAIIVTAPAPATAVYGTIFTVVATGGGSGKPLVYGSSGACMNSGPTFTMTSGTGTCTVTVDQAGNSNYNDAVQVVESVTAQKANQMITFAALVDRTYGDPDFAVSATANSGLPVAFSASGNCAVSGNVVHMTGAGSCTITAGQGGNANYNASASVPETFTITIAKQPTPTMLAYTGGTVFANGGTATLSAILRGTGTGPISGSTVVFTLGAGASAQTCSGTTDVNGNATCTLSGVAQPLGPGSVTATFGGDANYLASSNRANTLLYAFAAGGNFVVGDRSAAIGASVVFWGAQWSRVNSLSGASAPASFKGFVDSVAAGTRGAIWTTDPGNSVPPPQGPLPSHMAVIVSSSVAKSGSRISGNTVQMVVVKTNAGYAANPGHDGTGTVVAVIPQ